MKRKPVKICGFTVQSATKPDQIQKPENNVFDPSIKLCLLSSREITV